MEGRIPLGVQVRGPAARLMCAIRAVRRKSGQPNKRLTRFYLSAQIPQSL